MTNYEYYVCKQGLCDEEVMKLFRRSEHMKVARKILALEGYAKVKDGEDS